MKSISKLFVASALFAGLALNAQDMQTGKGIVRVIKGSAKYSNGGDVWMPLKVGTVLKPGSAIQADTESIVDIFLGINGPTLRVTSETAVVLDNLAFSGRGDDAVIETKINLHDGRILGSVRKLSAASKYEVKTPTGVAGIRGTDYDISTHKVNGKYKSKYICLKGTIIGADTWDDVTTSFQANEGQGFESGGPGVGPVDDSEGQGEINQANNDTTPTGGIDIGGGPGENGNPIIVHVSPTTGSTTTQ